MLKVEKQFSVKRFYDALVKHNGVQNKLDKCRIEIDLSVLLELFALEDYIKTLEKKITEQEVIIVNLETQIKYPKLNKGEFEK